MELGEYFNKVRNKRITIIGDAIVDKYITGTTTRISPDAPVPVLDVEQKDFYKGGIGLVANYVLSFGGIADICTVVGQDFEGDFLFKEFQKLNLGLKGIFKADSFTPQVTRIKAKGQQLLRLEKRYEFKPATREDINVQIESFTAQSVKNTDLIVLLDYNSGIFSHNNSLARKIITTAKQAGVKVLARPDKNNYTLFTGVDIAKFNLNLAAGLVGINSINETSVRIIATKLMNELQSKGLFLSYADANSYCLDGDKFEVIPRFLAQRGISYVGVGSATVATLALMIAAGAPLSLAASVASMAGALSAMKPPVTYFPLQELQEAYTRGKADICQE
jgi:rfaE bifunctional protein kinase chain/domain